MTTVCLAMIVKDEEEVVGRCIESVRELIDYWVICDTGSTDSTRARALEALGSIPGEWHETAWVDFGHNRSELMALARGRADYLLLLDADETVTWSPDVKEKLHADAYRILHHGTLEHWTNLKVVRGDIPWRYVGAAHEYLAADSPFNREFLPDLTINVHVEKPRGAKLRRNLELLLAQVEKTPDVPRFHFYLAETYRDLFHLTEPRDREYAERAIEHYRCRIALSGGVEAFLSHCSIGILLDEAMEDWPAAMDAFVEAWELRPDRMEPLYELVSRLRQRGHANTAYALLQPALGTPLPPEGVFVKRWIYEWGIQFEHALLAYAVGDFEASLASTESLLGRSDLPAAHRQGFEELRRELLELTAQSSPSGTEPRR